MKIICTLFFLFIYYFLSNISFVLFLYFYYIIQIQLHNIIISIKIDIGL